MKKLTLSLFAIMLSLTSCKHEVTYEPAPEQTPVAHEEIQPEKAAKSYEQWDRMTRADVDMHNMYVNSPRTLERPLDMYMSFALALKYNYTRRMTSYENSLLGMSRSPVSKLPELLSQAGYINKDSISETNSDLKVAWNILDISSVYYQSVDKQYASGVSYEQSRKVVHNILQETRALYWKALTAQRLLPVLDEMVEYMVLQVDEINIKAKTLAESGQNLAMGDLTRKRLYMDAVKRLSTLKREIETAEMRLASFMGFHPSTQYKLVGDEYGHFALPEIKSNLSRLEWLALTNRPELRIYDLTTDPESLRIYTKNWQNPGAKKYKDTPDYYNKMWSKKARAVGLSIFEDVRNPNAQDLETLRRQRMTGIVVSQVYVAWAQMMSALEDYQISQEIADTSENIAEDVTIKIGSRATKSHLEASRAIEDEVKASNAYIELQESLGNLYSTVGLDALPYFMLEEKPSKIAIYLRASFEKWRKGKFLPDNRPYLLDIPSKRPPVNLSSPLMPDMEVEVGQRILVKVPDSIIKKMNFRGKIVTKAGLINDKPLPKWLKYDEEKFTLYGIAMPSDIGEYKIKIYITDETGSIGYIIFKITVTEVFVPSMKVMGLTEGRKATIMKRCKGPKNQCLDEYVEQGAIGLEVEKQSDVATPSY